MEETGFVARQSKKMTIIGIICGGILTGFCLMSFVILCFSLEKYLSSDKLIFYVGTGSAFAFFIVTATLLIIVVRDYYIEKDIYYSTRMVRKRGKRILFELPYEKIITMRCDFGCQVMLFTGKPFYKRMRTVLAYYEKNDISRIHQIIGNANPKLYVIR